MGHYFQGKTHYEYTNTNLSAPIERAKRILDQPGESLLQKLQGQRRAADIVGRSKDERDSDFSRRVSAIFQALVDGILGGDYSSYAVFADNGDIARAIAPLIPHFGRSPIMNEVIMAYHIGAQRTLKGPTYEFSKSITRQLYDTEIRGVQTDEVRLPFPAIYIDIPPTEDLCIHNPISGIHNICGAYLAEDFGGSSYLLRAFVVGQPKGEIGGMPDDATMYYHVALKPGLTMEEAFESTKKRATDLFEDPTNEDMWHNIYAWLLNALLYITWGEPGEKWIANKEARSLWNRIQKLPKESKRRKKLNDKFRKLDPQHRILIGRTVVYTRPEGHKAGSKIASTFRVSGHWKRQHYGKGGESMKRIFIEPYWKGAGDTPLVPGQYAVK